MSTIHVRPGEGRHYPMIDGDHIAKAAVKDAFGTFEVFEVVVALSTQVGPTVTEVSGPSWSHRVTGGWRLRG